MKFRLVLILVAFICSEVAGRDLRLNQVESTVVIPTDSNDYALKQAGSKLFLAWIERASSDWQVVLVEVDLELWKVRELFKETPPEGIPSSPVLEIHDGQLVLSWLVKRGGGSRMRYELEVLCYQCRDEQAGNKASLPYGYQPKGFQLLSSSAGLFAGGVTVPSRRGGMRLFLYQKGPAGWLPLDIPEGGGGSDSQASMTSGAESLHLAWVRDGKVNVSSWSEGRGWDKSQVLSGKGASSPLLIAGGSDDLGLVWVEKPAVRKTRIKLASSPDQGVTWWHSTEAVDIEGSGLRFRSAFHRSSKIHLVYSYYNSRESCEMIDFCIMAPDWKRYRLDRFENEVCGRSLNPSVCLSENSLTVVWQERLGRATSVALNHARYPWNDWLGVPAKVVTSDGSKVLVAPKMAELNGRVFLLYFVYEGKRGPFQKNLQVGDLQLKELDANDRAIWHADY